MNLIVSTICDAIAVLFITALSPLICYFIQLGSDVAALSSIYHFIAVVAVCYVYSKITSDIFESTLILRTCHGIEKVVQYGCIVKTFICFSIVIVSVTFYNVKESHQLYIPVLVLSGINAFLSLTILMPIMVINYLKRAANEKENLLWIQ